MSNTTLDCSAIFQYDGDIAGLGVRLSFYLQNFVLGMSLFLEINGPGMVVLSQRPAVLLVDRSYEDAENALWTFIATR
jgi:hypothetical protein